MKIYQKLTTEFYNTGRITANIKPAQLDAEKPETTCEEFEDKDVYVEYFDTYSQARAVLDTAEEDYTII